MCSTIGVLVCLIAAALGDLPWSIRTASSVVAGLVGVRLFVMYHDYQHGAILSNSRIAGFLMSVVGMVMLNPPSVWNRSHDHHHKNNSKTFGANIGSYPIMTTHAYGRASPAERFAYAAARHPLTIGLGYFTVFIWGMSLRPFFMSPRRHLDGGLAVLVNLGTNGLSLDNRT